MEGFNLYSVANGDYYTSVFVIAKDEEEAKKLAKEAYIKDNSSTHTLRCDLVIEDISVNKASEVWEA